MKTETNSRAFLVLLVFLSMVGPLTLNILVPSMPGMAESLRAPKESVQLTLSLYLMGMAASQLVLGSLADRFGRRPVVVLALITYVAASLAAFLAPTVEWLILARILQSFGGTAGLTLARTMIRDLHGRNTSASMIGYVTMALMVAPMVAPLLGGLIDDFFGWRAIMIFCAILGTVAFLIAALSLPETRPVSFVVATWGDIGRRSGMLLRNARFMGFLGTGAFCSSIYFVFIGTAPHLMIDVLKLPKLQYGLWFVAIALAFMCGNYMSGRFAERVGVEHLIYRGNVISVVGAVIMLATSLFGQLSPVTLFLPIMLTSFAAGLVLPSAAAGGIGIDPQAAGASSGLLGFSQMGLGALASFAGGKVTTDSALPLAGFILFFAFAALIAGWFARRP
ncbi:ProP Permeases of the major facilitator superfamily [Rhabdaerophilaceae bacterium]